MRNKYHIKNNKKVFLYPKEWKSFFNKLTETQQPYFKIVINTGGRINEILNVTPDDINEERKQLTFRIVKVRTKLKERRPTPRTIQISSECTSWLMRYIKRHSISKKTPISQISKGTIQRLMKEHLKDIRKKDWNDFSSHNIRKTHGNWLLALAVDGQEVATRLGHDMNTMIKAYVSATLFNMEDRILIREELGDLYKDIARY